jgi:hypothetical protein
MMLSFLMSAHAQPITWEKLFSSPGTDVFRNVRQVSSGGYVAAGYTSKISLNDTDAYVVRVTVNGDTSWTLKYNGPMSQKDLLYKVIPTMDGGFAACGYSTSYTGVSEDVLLMKLNSSGVLQWVKYWGGNGRDRAQDIVELPNGNLAVVGYTTSPPAQYYDAFILITDAHGNPINSRIYGDSGYDDANSLQLLSDGGFILGGQSYNGAQGLDQYLIRINSSLDTLWTRKFGTVNTDNIEYVLSTPTGFYLAGNTSSPTTADDAYLVKTDTSGLVLWTRTFGGSLPDDFHTVKTTSDGGLICTGTTRSYGPLNPNLWLVKTTASGDSLWSRTYGGDNHDHGYYAEETTDGGFIIAGYSSSFGFNQEEAMLIKTDSQGNIANLLKYTAVTALLEPVSSTCGGPNTQIKVVIRNFGLMSMPSVPITIKISGYLDTTLTQTFPFTFAPNESDTITFMSTINTAGLGTYTFNCYTGNNNDVFPAMNSFTTTFTKEGYAPPPQAVNSVRCGPGTLSLSASSVSPINWFNNGTGGTSLYSGNTYLTPSLSSTTTYYVQAGINCLSSRTPVVAEVSSSGVDPVTTSIQNCGPGSVTLTASSQDSIRWYDAINSSTVLATGSSYLTPVISATTTYYAESGAGACLSNRIPATVVIHTAADFPVTTSAQRCGPGGLSLSASSTDLILWYSAPAGGSLVGSGSSLVTPSLGTTVTYYAQSFNSFCQSPRIPALAEVFSIPSVNLGSDTILTIATSLSLDAGPGFIAYLWSTGDQTQDVTVATSGTYCVTVTGDGNCSSSDCIMVNITTGIDKNYSSEKILVYPNPATDKIKVTLPSSIQSATFDLFDLRGSSILHFTDKQSEEIDLSYLPKGIYVLKAATEKFTHIQKIVLR